MLSKVLPMLVGLAILTSLIIPAYSHAAEQTTLEATDPNVKNAEESDLEVTDVQVEEQQTQSQQDRRFDSFVPSEQISADNAVPFPVDI